MVTPAAERRACRLIKADRKTIRYRSHRPPDEDLRRRLKELAAEQRRFGYRRLHVLLRAEGHAVNRKKTQRLYREEGLTVQKRKGRKRAAGSRAPILTEARPNARWSVDFVQDQLSGGRRFRMPIPTKPPPCNEMIPPGAPRLLAMAVLSPYAVPGQAVLACLLRARRRLSPVSSMRWAL